VWNSGWERTRDWLRNTKSGRNWLLVILPLQIISAWTNILGLQLALPFYAALVLGIGLQVIALYVGIGMINADEEQRPAWRKALMPVLALSVFFSFAGFTSAYQEDIDRKTRPMREWDDLREQAAELSAKADEGRRLALSAYQNRIDYARDIATRVRRKQMDGYYADNVEASTMVAEMQARIDAAESAKAEWEDFNFNAANAMDRGTVSAGFGYLQDNYRKLGSLMGKLRREEARSFVMPDPPLLSLQAAEAAPQKDLITFTFWQLFSLSGWFWLGLAFMLEAIPFWVAHANPPRTSAEAEEEEIRLEEIRTDRRLAGEVQAFNAMLRPLHFIGAEGPTEIERQAQRVDAVSEEVRKSFVGELRLRLLAKDLKLRDEQLLMMVEAARRRGVPESELAKIVQEDWVEVMKDFGIEQLRLERQREERRTEVMETRPETSS
jgi:hypothetical protein